jgi:hypothetical protein
MHVYTEGFDKYPEYGGGRFGDVVHARVIPTKTKTNVTWFTHLRRASFFRRLLHLFIPQKRTVYVTFEYTTKHDLWNVLEAKVDVPFETEYATLDLGVWLNGKDHLTIAREPVIFDTWGKAKDGSAAV